MHLDPHPLLQDSPEMAALAQRLLRDDPHFARQSADYQALQQRLQRIEEGREPLPAEAAAELRQVRDRLAAELNRQLKRASGKCCGCGNACGG